MAEMCGTCLRTAPTLTSGECPPCSAKHPPPQHRPRAPQASGWHRYPIEYRTNRAIVLAGGPPCFWRCGRPATTADHITPRIQGGSHDITNLVPACSRCNTGRGSRDAATHAATLGLDLAQLLDEEQARRLGTAGGGAKLPQLHCW